MTVIMFFQILKKQRTMKIVEGIFNYSNDKIFEHNDIIQAMKREPHDASLGHPGLLVASRLMTFINKK